MSISLTEDIKTMVELQENAQEIVDQIHQTGRPVVVTSGGKPDVVILDAAAYERRLKIANLAQLLMEGEADVRAGRVRPAEDFFDELNRGKKISR